MSASPVAVEPGKPAWRTRLRRAAIAIGLALAAIAGGGYGLDRLDRAYPPPLDLPASVSAEVVDRHGEPLRIFANAQGRWRLPADLDRIDPEFLRLLIAYEDKRFYAHWGVDLFAAARAAAQVLIHGRIVSGGSTITMQLARLIEPRQERSMAAKLRQTVRALQIERRLSKREILTRYLTLAPYGGNVEGVRAASLVWFGKEPDSLSLAEAALLVALPQSPEARRPDRHPAAAAQARSRVVARMVQAGLIAASEQERLAAIATPQMRRAMPALAPHLSRAALDRNPSATLIATRLDAGLQARLEQAALDGARRAGPLVSVAIVAADAQSGDILASVGSPDFRDESRQGWIDMTRALRSPGSTLKPFIYGLALEDGLVLPETTISDRPADFHGYRPTNFDMTYQGDVSVRQALQMSLNVPAIRLLDALGPARLMSRMRRAGVSPTFPKGEVPGLSLGLGGAGLSLVDLVQLYANLASPGGLPIALGDGVTRIGGPLPGQPMLSPVASWHVGDMLSGIAKPAGSRSLSIAWKTGTSYGYRDAWAVGYDGRHVIGVWVGRADNGAVPGIAGASTAGPILFEAFDRSGFNDPLGRAPAGAVRIAAQDLPAPLRRFGDGLDRLPTLAAQSGQALNIAFPLAGSQLELASMGDGAVAPVIVKLQGGTPPFRLLADGRPSGEPSRVRQLQWRPDGRGFARLTVLDAKGRAQSVEIALR